MPPSPWHPQLLPINHPRLLPSPKASSPLGRTTHSTEPYSVLRMRLWSMTWPPSNNLASALGSPQSPISSLRRHSSTSEDVMDGWMWMDGWMDATKTEMHFDILLAFKTWLAKEVSLVLPSFSLVLLHFAGNLFKCIFLHENVWILIKKIHRSLFLRVQFMIFQHWFR